MNKTELISTYYSQHRDELLAFVSSRLGCFHASRLSWSDVRAEAEDLVQDVFLRLLATDKMLTEQTLPALVYTVCRHLVCDYCRRHSHHDEYEHYIRSTSTNESSMESVFFAADVVAGMERGLARIPENSREIYRMHILGGMRVSEISAQLGENYKSVENRLGQARRQVRSYLRAVV